MKRVLKILLAIIVVAGILAGWIFYSNSIFKETFYSLESDKIETPIRIIQVSDLHEKSFGADNDELVTRIGELHPDLILLTGDIVNRDDTNWDYVIELCEKLSEIAVVCYGLGNHENEALYGSDLNNDFLAEQVDLLGNNPEDFSPLEKNPEITQKIKDTGVYLLQNEYAVLNIKDNEVVVGGISTNINSFWPYSGQFITDFTYEYPQSIKVLISHRPEPVIKYISDYPLDFVLSGHTHGGIIRIPGKGGLLSTEGELFPEYDSGVFELDDDITMVISRGMGNHGPVPRIFNTPELVVLDIN